MDEVVVSRVADAFGRKYGKGEVHGRDALLCAYSADFFKEYAGVDTCTYEELAEAGRRHNEKYGHATKWCDHMQSGNARRSDFNGDDDERKPSFLERIFPRKRRA